MSTEDDLHVLAMARHWAENGANVALAVVLESWGSSPRPPGSLMAVAGDGRMAGSVSGGCVEAAVAEEAMTALRAGGLRLLEYGVSNERAWEAGLACGGRVRILVEPLSGHADKIRMLGTIAEACAGGGEGIILARSLTTGEWRLQPMDGQLRQPVKREDWFLHPLYPPMRMILVGAVHVAQALAGLAVQMGFACTVLDPRRALMSPDRFPGAELTILWPDEGIGHLRPDARTAVIVLSHDPKLDDPALLAALKSPAFYIGALGSAATHAARLDRLRREGAAQTALGRIHGPAGLRLGGRGASDIALSILAQVAATRHGALTDERMAPGYAGGHPAAA